MSSGDLPSMAKIGLEPNSPPKTGASRSSVAKGDIAIRKLKNLRNFWLGLLLDFDENPTSFDDERRIQYQVIACLCGMILLHAFDVVSFVELTAEISGKLLHSIPPDLAANQAVIAIVRL